MNSTLARKLSALVDTPMDSKIEIVPRHEDGTGFAALQRLVSYLADEISAPDNALAAPALAELEQAVLVAFLYANPNHFSKLLYRKPCSIAPWQVVRAEEYIEANWNSVLTIESLAEAIGASARRDAVTSRTPEAVRPGGGHDRNGSCSRVRFPEHGSFRNKLPEAFR